MSDYLPQEMIVKILQRLPPKSLIAFRLVSKSWYAMISTPFFIKLHTQQTLLSSSSTSAPPKKHQLLVRRYSKLLNSEVYSVHTDTDKEFLDNDVAIEYPFRDDVRFYYRIVGSCNGLLCLLDDQLGHAHDVQLWNPVIRRKLALPPPQSSLEDLDPSKCLIVLGFGFDVRSEDYKVVRITYVIEPNCEYLLPPKVEVYALSQRMWHTVEGEIPKNRVVEHFWSQVFINGKVHWVAFKLMGRNNKLENLMMAFDITHEVFEEMALPEPLENELSFNLGAVDLRGSLAVVQYDERVWNTQCSVWVMKEYGDVASWCRDYSIRLDCGIGVVLGVRGNGHILMTTRQGGLVSYDQVTEKCADLGLSGTKDSFYVGPYNESLALLVEGNLARERLSSDSDSYSDVGYETPNEYDEEKDVDENKDEYEDEYDEEEEGDRWLGDVEKSEFWMECHMTQYLTAMLRRPYI